MNALTNINTLSDLRKQYKESLKKYYPDSGGSEEITKAVNTEYNKLFKVLKARYENNSADYNQNATDNGKSDYNATMYGWENVRSLREICKRLKI